MKYVLTCIFFLTGCCNQDIEKNKVYAEQKCKQRNSTVIHLAYSKWLFNFQCADGYLEQSSD